MKPVDQDILAVNDDGTDAHGRPGNCYQACLASILDEPLEAVPHLVALPGDWYINTQLWTLQQGLVHTVVDPSDTQRLDAIDEAGEVLGYIGAGPSPRGPFQHAVVLDPVTLETAHDPHPSRKGITETQLIEVLWRPREARP